MLPSDIALYRKAMLTKAKPGVVDPWSDVSIRLLGSKGRRGLICTALTHRPCREKKSTKGKIQTRIAFRRNIRIPFNYWSNGVSTEREQGRDQRKEVKNRHMNRNRKLAWRKGGKITARRDKKRRQRTEIGNDESKEGIRGANNEIQERRPVEKRNTD